MLNPLSCPDCHSEHCAVYKSYETLHNGSRLLYHCSPCKPVFSETKGTFLEGLKKPISLIVKVFKARTEGLV